jgi:hypothetical protein
MKMLLSTTALVVALGFPTVTLAQTNQAGTNQSASQQGGQMQGFMSNRGQSDLFASELMGHDVYARRMSNEGNQQQTGGQAGNQQTAGQAGNQQQTGQQGMMNQGGTFDMATMNRADLDGMDNIGQINEIVLSNDGQVRAIVIGVGGFLGMGEQDVAVTMDQVTFARDTDEWSQMYIVVNTGADQLQNSPAFDRTAMAQEQSVIPGDTNFGNSQQRAADQGAAGDGTRFTAPGMTRDGYNQVEVTEVTSDLLVGQTVYGVNDDSVGTIDNLVLDNQGAISDVIIDFGGFLGIGTSQVSVGFDELTILANEGYADVRVYVDATQDQVQARPRYSATN